MHCVSLHSFERTSGICTYPLRRKTFLLVSTAKATTDEVRSTLFMGAGFPEHPDLILGQARERENRSRGTCCVKNFDDAVCETDGYRSYYLRVDEAGQVLFGHYGSDTFLNRKAGIFPVVGTAVSSPLQSDKLHIGIATQDKTVSFLDMVVSAKPPPMLTSPDALCELAQLREDLRHLHVPFEEEDVLACEHGQSDHRRSAVHTLYGCWFSRASRLDPWTGTGEGKQKPRDVLREEF
mmetsp:Transcript_61316/g.197584  ORF Transcript_61316/g.197584 Transcript_61316/m.197584 type:complete len:237 (-) Transcript_61316:160-870(-)